MNRLAAWNLGRELFTLRHAARTDVAEIVALLAADPTRRDP